MKVSYKVSKLFIRNFNKNVGSIRTILLIRNEAFDIFHFCYLHTQESRAQEYFLGAAYFYHLSLSKRFTTLTQSRYSFRIELVGPVRLSNCEKLMNSSTACVTLVNKPPLSTKALT